ncbi:hypothetical protein Tco_0546661 [Tanacetum coccineum]
MYEDLRTKKTKPPLAYVDCLPRLSWRESIVIGLGFVKVRVIVGHTLDESLDEELREFTSEYTFPSPHCTGSAGCVMCELAEISQWGRLGGHCRGMSVPPPGSYSMEDAELINENRIPINAYSEAFLCHMGISRNYFQSPEEVPTFIGDDGRGGCLSFLLPRSVVAHNGKLVGASEVRVLMCDCTNLRSVPGATVEPPGPEDNKQAALVAQLRARLSSERGQSVQKDEEILLLKTQLADAQAEAESSRSYAQKLAEEKMALLVKVEQERADSADYKASLEGHVGEQEEKYAKSVFEYDEELLLNVVPRLLSAGGISLWSAPCCHEHLESLVIKLVLWGCCEVCLGSLVKARRKIGAVEELHERKLADCACRSELPHIAQLERDQDYPIGVIRGGVPIFACPRDILNPFALKKEIPLKESLEAHAIRHAKKKGLFEGQGQYFALEEAGDAAYQVGSSERSRCHSI